MRQAVQQGQAEVRIENEHFFKEVDGVGWTALVFLLQVSPGLLGERVQVLESFQVGDIALVFRRWRSYYLEND